MLPILPQHVHSFLAFFYIWFCISQMFNKWDTKRFEDTKEMNESKQFLECILHVEVKFPSTGTN